MIKYNLTITSSDRPDIYLNLLDTEVLMELDVLEDVDLNSLTVEELAQVMERKIYNLKATCLAVDKDEDGYISTSEQFPKINEDLLKRFIRRYKN
mgnify:FL=1